MTKRSLLLIGLLVGVLLVAASPMVAYADDDDDRGSRGTSTSPPSPPTGG